MTKYIVSGYIGFDNFGDEAIAKVLVDRLKHEGAEKITLISSNPEKTAKLYGVDSCPMLKFFDSIKHSDVLVSGGGSLLQDVTSFKSLLYYLGVIYTAIFLGKKIEIFAQGIGPINSGFGRMLTRFALGQAQKISVRDRKSQELLKSWGIDAELVKDPIFSLELPVRNLKGTVGIQLRNYPSLSDGFLNALADEVIKRFPDKKIQIFSFQDSIDLDVCEKFARILAKKDRVKDVEVLSGLSVNDVFDKISELEYMIGMRFHANVAAIISGVKTLAINYDIKVKKLADEYDLPVIELSQRDFTKEFDKLG